MDDSHKYNVSKNYLLLLLLIFYFFNKIFLNKKFSNKFKIIGLKKYINDCKKLKRYSQKKVFNEFPYLSICLSALNMENYIERAILSILNQSFQDFEIIIINDNSQDNTQKIINRMKSEDNRIKSIEHSTNLGVFKSRIEAIFNSKGKFIILMDPDDMFLNKDLIKKLYEYNFNINLDIIEFSVFREIEDSNTIFYPNNHFQTHYHNFQKNIIYQPELSNILFYLPEEKNYSHTICRNIWNKMINRKILLNAINYIGNDYINEFIITADDILMNIISYHFAHNFSNIELPGYLYTIRKISMSHGDGGNELQKIRAINYFLYFKIFYKYIKQFKKDRNFIYYEMKDFNNYILDLKNLNISEYISKALKYLYEIKRDKYASNDFKNYCSEIIFYFTN